MRKKEKSLQTQQLTTSPSVRKLRVCWSCLCFTILSKLSQRRSHFHIRGFGTKTAAIWQPADYQTIFRRPLSVILLQHQTEVDSLTDAVTHPAATRRDGTTGCVSTHPRILGCFFLLNYVHWNVSKSHVRASTLRSAHQVPFIPTSEASAALINTYVTAC